MIVHSCNPPEPDSYLDMRTGVIYTLPEEKIGMDCLVSYDYAVQVSADTPVREDCYADMFILGDAWVG